MFYKFIAGILVFLSFFVLDSFQEVTAQRVNNHRLECTLAIPCPKDIWPRVDFWIDVYSRWVSTDAILHDKTNPERVYRVLSGESCGGKKVSDVVERHKDEIRKKLKNLADDIDAGIRISNSEDRALLALFPKRSVAIIKDAIDGIRCQSGNRDRFYQALKRYDLYGALVRNVLSRAGLPSDIQYLPLVESFYDPAAYSRLGAAGLWQIMPGTAKELGLNLTATVDERLDPELATYAAAAYLSKSYVSLMSASKKILPEATSSDVSPFVITSYNYGVNGMRRAIVKHGPDYSLVLDNYESPSFQVAVKNFYATFLAARHVAKNANRYFGQRDQIKPIDYQTLLLTTPVSLKRVETVFGISRADLRQYNPALTRFVWQEWRLIPTDYRLRLPRDNRSWKDQITTLSRMTPESDKSLFSRYIVKNGDTACGVANAFQVRCLDLIELNRLDASATIQIGQRLEIPKNLDREQPLVRDPGGYRVRKGDSACSIAHKFGVACDALLSANNLARKSILKVNQYLLIPASVQQKDQYQSYVVRQDDTVCVIASKYGITCKILLETNGLNLGSLIFPGQALRIPQFNGSKIVSEGGGDLEHVVRQGETACGIANQYGIKCEQLILFNKLGNEDVILPEQKLVIPGVWAEKYQHPLGLSPLDQTFDFSVQVADINGKKIFRINAEATETLEHYADWLMITDLDMIRQLNHDMSSESLYIGDVLLLPITSEKQLDTFQRERQDYHRMLVEEFRQTFKVVDVYPYTALRGDSLWAISRKFDLPVWIMTRYNPSLRSQVPHQGDQIQVPLVEPRTR
tara:strand:- start:2507 stop:4918 length:2412 start_codon:yes stop_codon:yes gene_type:complete